MDDIRIGFLDSLEFDGGAIRGAMLVTSRATEPVEFRCTSPVCPTLLQKTLWGDRLAGYIASQLLGKPLLDALSTPVSLLIVRRPEFIELRPLIQVPMIQLLRDQELTLASPLAATDGDDRLDWGPIGILVMKVHRAHGDDRSRAREALAESLRTHDLLEPFGRIKNALGIVHQQEAAHAAK